VVRTLLKFFVGVAAWSHRHQHNPKPLEGEQSSCTSQRRRRNGTGRSLRHWSKTERRLNRTWVLN